MAIKDVIFSKKTNGFYKKIDWEEAIKSDKSIENIRELYPDDAFELAGYDGWGLLEFILKHKDPILTEMFSKDILEWCPSDIIHAYAYKIGWDTLAKELGIEIIDG